MNSGRILIIAPAYNEEKGVGDFVKAFLALREEVARDMELRLLIVDDGSTDGTLGLLKGFAAKAPGIISFLSLSANFGHQAALVAGMMNAGSWPDAIVTIDSDLEHPLELLPRMVSLWKDQGCLLVNTTRKHSTKLGFTKRAFSALFYWLTARLTRLPLRAGQADFRLWDAGMARELSGYLLHIGSLRVFAAWLRVKKGNLDYRQRFRRKRKSRFTFAKNWELAMISIIRFSSVPLHAITFLGGLGLVFSLGYLVFILVAMSHGQPFVKGWPSLILTIITMSCLQLLSIGILAMYIRRLIFSKDLPLFLIKENGIRDES